MRKLIGLIAWLMMLCLPVQAQENPLVTSKPDVSAHMNLEFYTSAAAYFTERNFDEAAFKINRVRLEILGSFSKEFNWHFRQSFNKYSNPHALDNLSSAIEYAYVNWKPSDKFNLTVGKQFVAMGGYEYYLNSNKVREFSEFNDYVAAYQAGIQLHSISRLRKNWYFKLLISEAERMRICMYMVVRKALPRLKFR